MSRFRLIARLDIKAPNLIKGVRLEGLRVMGDPNLFAKRYYEQGADELLYMDIVASLYERNSLLDIVERTTRDVFVPITVGGGIRTIEDARQALRSGADKVAINSAAIRRPSLISEMAEAFGSQCMVLSIEAKKSRPGFWEAYTDNGREHSGLSVVDWVAKGASLGAGEILVTSVDREGTRMGFDYDLISAVASNVKVPVIASGGFGDPRHACQAAEAGVDGIAVADSLHYNRTTVGAIREAAKAGGLDVREPAL